MMSPLWIGSFLIGVIVAGHSASAWAALSDSIGHTQGRPAAIVSTLKQWSPKDRFRPSEETYRVEQFEDQEFADKTKLERTGILENAFFRIVDNQSDEALGSGDFDGSNVIFHLMEARNYFVHLASSAKSGMEALNRKVTVRVRVDRAYNLVNRFSEIEDYNNARYIPAHFDGQWGREIWFHAKKAGFQKMNWFGFTQIAGSSIIGQDWAPLAVLGPLQLIERFNAGLDGAKTPDVIYHEAFHWATDEEGYFPMAAEGHAIAEDYANYFASSLNGRAMVAEIDEFSSRFYKRNFIKIKPVKDPSSLKYNSTSFGASIFWEIRRMLGQARADQLIWNSMAWLRGSVHHTDVPAAVVSAAMADSQLSTEDVDAIRDLFEMYKSSYETLEIKFNGHRSSPAEPVSVVPTETDMSGREVSVEERVSEDETDWTKSLRNAWNWGSSFVVDSLQVIGYVGGGVGALMNVPTTFSADLVTGLIFGSALLSDHESGLWTQVTGAASGLSLTGAVVSQMSSSTLSVVYPLNLSGLATSMANSIVCRNADPKGLGETDRYCAKYAEIVAKITMSSASVGAKIGIGIHDEIVSGFRKLF